VDDGTRVPDLFGTSLRLAARAIRDAGFEPIVQGTGIVVAQEPEAGASAPAGARVTLRAVPGEEILVASNDDDVDGEGAGGEGDAAGRPRAPADGAGRASRGAAERRSR
jgi:hypothetical protein